MLRALGDHPSTAWAVPALETTTVRQVFHAVTVGGVGVHDLALVERSGSGRLAVRVPNVEGDPHERILLGLHYWVGWNELADSVATNKLKMEEVNAERIQQIRCCYCKRAT